jgi:hypothetical protein
MVRRTGVRSAGRYCGRTTPAEPKNDSALWKTKEWDDSLYTFGVGVAATISARTQLKVEVLDVYKM